MFTLDKLNRGQMFDLENLLGSIAPKDIPTLKEMSHLKKLRVKLQEGSQSVIDAISELQEFLKPMRDRKASDEEMNEAGKDRFASINALRSEPTSVELSDEQVECFRRWFNDKLKSSITNVDACLLVAEAIGIDLEA